MAIASKRIRVHQIQGGKAEGIQYMPYTTGQTFHDGELLKYDAGANAGNVIVMDAAVAAGTLVGVAMQAADSSPGFQAANNPATFTYRSQKVSVVRPNDQTIFQAELTNGSNVVVAPTDAGAAGSDVGAQYGLTAYAGVWTVDKSKTGANAKVEIIGVDTVQNVVFFKFLSAFLA